MELRAATREEFDDFSRAALWAFHREFTDTDRKRYERIDEPERSLAWFDDGRIVATTSAFTRELTVPGAAVACGGDGRGRRPDASPARAADGDDAPAARRSARAR